METKYNAGRGSGELPSEHPPQGRASSAATGAEDGNSDEDPLVSLPPTPKATSIVPQRKRPRSASEAFTHGAPMEDVDPGVRGRRTR